MRRNERAEREDMMLKPIGAAAAAVLAGLAGGAHAAPAVSSAPVLAPETGETTRAHYVDPTNHAGFEQDDSLILGPSAPVEPFAAAPAKQGDLFDL